MVEKEKKFWDKSKNVFNKAKDRIGGKVKDKVKEKVGNLKHRSYFDDFHMTKGEMIVNRECRQALSTFVLLIQVLLLLLSIGELILSAISYYKFGDFTALLSDFNPNQLLKYMISTFVVLFGFELYAIWVITDYQFAEEQRSVVAIKSSHVWLKILFYASFPLAFILIVLMIWCSKFFNNLDNEIGKSIQDHVKVYHKNIESKTQLDRLQWYYECCGSESSNDYMGQDWAIGPKDIEWAKRRFAVNESTAKQMFRNSVPFSCCKRFSETPCAFITHVSKTVEEIHGKGCKEKIMDSFNDFKRWVKIYRLLELLSHFAAMIAIDLIHHSIQSEFDARVVPPIARFPTFYAVVMLIILVVLYFAYF